MLNYLEKIEYRPSAAEKKCVFLQLNKRFICHQIINQQTHLNFHEMAEGIRCHCYHIVVFISMFACIGTMFTVICI